MCISNILSVLSRYRSSTRQRRFRNLEIPLRDFRRKFWWYVLIYATPICHFDMLCIGCHLSACLSIFLSLVNYILILFQKYLDIHLVFLGVFFPHKPFSKNIAVLCPHTVTFVLFSYTYTPLVLSELLFL